MFCCFGLRWQNILQCEVALVVFPTFWFVFVICQTAAWLANFTCTLSTINIITADPAETFGGPIIIVLLWTVLQSNYGRRDNTDTYFTSYANQSLSESPKLVYMHYRTVISIDRGLDSSMYRMQLIRKLLHIKHDKLLTEFRFVGYSTTVTHTQLLCNWAPNSPCHWSWSAAQPVAKTATNFHRQNCHHHFWLASGSCCCDAWPASTPAEVDCCTAAGGCTDASWSWLGGKLRKDSLDKDWLTRCK